MNETIKVKEYFRKKPERSDLMADIKANQKEEIKEEKLKKLIAEYKVKEKFAKNFIREKSVRVWIGIPDNLNLETIETLKTILKNYLYNYAKEVGVIVDFNKIEFEIKPLIEKAPILTLIAEWGYS